TTDGTHLEPEGGIFERLDHLTPTESTQVATAGARRAIGVLTCKGREVRSSVELAFDSIDLLLSLLLGARRAGSRGSGIHEQNVGSSDLALHGTPPPRSGRTRSLPHLCAGPAC